MSPKRAIDRPDYSLLHWGVRLTILAAFVLVATPAFSIELFRYRGAAKDVSDMVKGQLRQMFFVVLLPDGTVIVPTVEKRL